jgi:O-antigen/teichoic acid export membrane protein
LNLVLNAVSLVLTSLLAYPFISYFGPPGAAWALLIGNIATTSLQAFYFVRLIREPG